MASCPAHMIPLLTLWSSFDSFMFDAFWRDSYRSLPGPVRCLFYTGIALFAATGQEGYCVLKDKKATRHLLEGPTRWKR